VSSCNITEASLPKHAPGPHPQPRLCHRVWTENEGVGGSDPPSEKIESLANYSETAQLFAGTKTHVHEMRIKTAS
jgi:hypothetical protein